MAVGKILKEDLLVVWLQACLHLNQLFQPHKATGMVLESLLVLGEGLSPRTSIILHYAIN